MSHYIVTVIGPDPEAQLAPFEEREGNEEKSMWDWYLLGGRWTGFLRLKDGASGKVGEPGIMAERASEGRADQARMGDIDWETMRKERALAAEEQWAAFEAELAKPHRDPSSDEVRRLAALKAGVWPMPDGVGPEDRKAFVAVYSSVHTYAVLKHGEWHGRGTMGWFGMSDDDMTEIEWAQRYMELLADVDDDELVSIYDLHI